MRKLAAIVCFIVFYPLSVFAAFPNEVIENVKSAVVALYLKEDLTGFRGSGFFIDSLGTLITAKHAVENYERLWAQLYNGKKLELILDRFEENNDLAVMLPIMPENEKIVFSYLKFGNTHNFVVGQPIAVVGNSYGSLWQVIYGNIRNLHMKITLEDNGLIFTVIEYNISIPKGFSGSPLIDENGELMGMSISTAAIKTSLDDNRSYAIRSAEIKSFMEEFHRPPESIKDF